ncbi:unnamed protein product, partial [Polarella glacialis]
LSLSGVNLGGWLNLEDWFFSGSAGRNVMTLQSAGQGACLPPLVQQLDKHWPSEGILIHRLREQSGPKYAASVMTAHRRTFIQEADLDAMRKLGIRTVRLPLNWAAFADALAPLDKKLYGTHDPDTTPWVVPDPFYKDQAAFVTVPRNML